MISVRQLVVRDYACALAAGLVAAGLSWFWRFPMPAPGVWEDLAVAALLRPPTGPFPALWQAGVAGLVESCGIVGAQRILEVLGHLSLGFLAAGAYFLFSAFLPVVMWTRMMAAGWSRRIVRLILLQGVFAAVCSDPIWRAGQFFSPLTLHLLLALLGALLFIRFLRSWRTSAAGLAMFVFGILSADTVFGILVTLGAVGIFIRVSQKLARSRDLVDEHPVLNKVSRMALSRWMLLAFSLGLGLGIGVNVSFFHAADGFAALAWDGLELFVRYLCRYAGELAGATTPTGWLCILLFVVSPLVVSLARVVEAADEERWLPMWHGVLFFLIGAATLLQLSGFDAFWFWTWGQSARVASSGLLLGFCSAMNALSFTLALSVLGVEVYFRNYRRLSRQYFPDAADVPVGRAAVANFGAFERWRRLVLLLEPPLFALMVFPFRAMTTERTMLGILRDSLAETIAECGDARGIVTDGALDAAVELAAAAAGRPLYALSMMGGGQPREAYLRLRAARSAEDRSVLETGTAEALRDWVRFRPWCAEDLAVQLGFELWRRDRREMPRFSGFLGRTAGLDETAAAAGSAAARGLARRILDLSAAGRPQDVPDVPLRTAFLHNQWRLARMCRLRSEGADWTRARDLAEQDARLADELDKANVELQNRRRPDDWVSLQRGSRLTSREGLRIGLERADFQLARMFAQTILQDDPDDPSANFAVGMAAFVEEQYGRAETYLRRALVKKPNAPSVLNNLGIVLMNQQRHDEAEACVLRALDALPASSPYLPKIRDTLTQIRKRRDAAANTESKEEKK
ncbi:MAG: tetratricopeptide repeat protein [Kiritimatiellia bacterium]